LGNIDRDVRHFKEVKERIDDNEGKRRKVILGGRNQPIKRKMMGRPIHLGEVLKGAMMVKKRK
jgi:hypothetical protein